MPKKTLILLLSALTLLASASCSHDRVPTDSSVILTFSTGDIVTKTAVADGTSIAYDNEEPDLFIAVVNSSNQIVARYPSGNADLLDVSTPSQVSVKLKNFDYTGEFTVYAVANTAGGVWGAPANAAAWQAITSPSALEALTFTPLTGSNIYSVDPDTGRLLLSAKGTLYVNEGHNGHADIELLRCVAKVAFKVKNETGELLTLTNCTVTIKDINPTEGYIFPHTNDAIGTARDLTLIQSQTLVDIGSVTNFYGDLLVFPSVAPARAVGSRYYCDISFTVNNESKSFTDLPIHDKQSRDITALNRNQYLQIETRINRGLDVSFNFVVDDWNEKTEDIIFH